jgi:hypothetical protein
MKKVSTAAAQEIRKVVDTADLVGEVSFRHQQLGKLQGRCHPLRQMGGKGRDRRFS